MVERLFQRTSRTGARVLIGALVIDRLKPRA